MMDFVVNAMLYLLRASIIDLACNIGNFEVIGEKTGA